MSMPGGSQVVTPPAEVEVVTNPVTNPSFELGVTVGWDAYIGTEVRTRDSTHGGAVGSWACKVTDATGGDEFGIITAAGGPYVVTAGLPYAVSAHVRVPSGHAFPTSRAVAWWFTAGAVPVSTEVVAVSGATDVWERISGTVTAPPTAANLYVYVTHYLDPGESWWVDAVAVTQTSSVLPYFDGDTPSDAVYTYTWTGPAHTTASTRWREL